MKRIATCLFLFSSLLSTSGMAQSGKDTTQLRRNYIIDEVVVTGTRNETDIRHLPMTISVVGRQQIEKRYEPSLLPLLTEQVPGFFTTSRGIMGYGVSTGAAGGMSLRGIGGSPTAGLLVLIDGHPQYMGLMGHPIADAYQSMMTEKVEILRGPASVLYGSNAMGGVINIVTRKQQQEGVNRSQRGFESSHQFATDRKQRIMIIIGESRILSRYGILLESGRDREITINFLSLHGLPGSFFIYKVLCHFKCRHSRYVSDDCPRRSSVILIDNADRNIFHLSVTKDGCHEKKGK